MGITATDRYFQGQGKVFIAERNTDGTNKGFIHLGNCTKLTESLKIEEQVLYESMSGFQLETKRIPGKQTCDVSMTLENQSYENLAIALYGTLATITGAAVSDADYTAHKDKHIPLAHMGVSSVVVKDAATGLITYSATTDYTLNADHGSIYIPATSTIVEDSTLHISYTYATQKSLKAFADAAKEYTVRFEGLNIADTNKEVVITIHKFRPTPMKEFSQISDKVQSIEISGGAMADTTRTTGDQFITVTELS